MPECAGVYAGVCRSVCRTCRSGEKNNRGIIDAGVVVELAENNRCRSGRTFILLSVRHAGRCRTCAGRVPDVCRTMPDEPSGIVRHRPASSGIVRHIGVVSTPLLYMMRCNVQGGNEPAQLDIVTSRRVYKNNRIIHFHV